MSTRLSALLLLILVLGVHPVGAQPALPVETFDLVLAGDHLRADAHRVALKTNPTVGAKWMSLDGATCTGPLLVFSGLSVDRYLGQDLRENHLTLRITTQSSDNGGHGALRAVYAVPSGTSFNQEICTRLARLARTAPEQIRGHSLAAYERPRPTPLRATTPFLDHVEAPVRHRKPGVAEAAWLNVLFGEEE